MVYIESWKKELFVRKEQIMTGYLQRIAVIHRVAAKQEEVVAMVQEADAVALEKHLKRWN
ncbi:MAG: hypothetical protein ACLU97_08645 [Dorea sp.]